MYKIKNQSALKATWLAEFLKSKRNFISLRDRKSVVQGKSVDLGGRRIIKKKKRKKRKKEKEKERKEKQKKKPS